MIDRINDVSIRETVFEEATEAKEPQAQDNISPEAEPIVRATPEYKSGLIAERRMDGQAQEMLLRNQLNETEQPKTRDPISFNSGSEPVIDLDEEPKNVAIETLKKLPTEGPEQLKRTAEAVVDLYTHPQETYNQIKSDVDNFWKTLKNSK